MKETNKSGSQFYYNSKHIFHRVDGPAIIWANGDKYWFINGILHRIDGPAIEWANGYKEWFINGKHHRIDGPAIEGIDGYKEWWVNNLQFHDEKDYIKYLIKKEFITDKTEIFKLSLKYL
jgi:hypothetical protein